MKQNTKLTILTAMIAAVSVAGAGCAGAADKDKSKSQAQDDIRWEAPAAPDADAAASAAAPAAGYDAVTAEEDMQRAWEEMNRMQQAMMSSFGGWGSGSWSRPTRPSMYSMGVSEMNADVAETDKEYVITCELPGVPKENIQIDVDGTTLVVRATRDAGTDKSGVENGQKYHYRERSFGTTERRFRIGSGVDPKKIKASLKDGVLTLRVPKGENRTVQVPIEG
jgi:HSP20 family molecular chaperone IbpA